MCVRVGTLVHQRIRRGLARRDPIRSLPSEAFGRLSLCDSPFERGSAKWVPFAGLLISVFKFAIDILSDRLDLTLSPQILVLGGVPEQHRSDSFSAAFRNLDRATQDDLTRRYEGAANTLTSSTTATSSMPCARSRWRSSTSSIAASCSHAAPTRAPSRRCSPKRARSTPAAPWWACWRSPRERFKPDRVAILDIAVALRRSPPMTNSPRFGRRMPTPRAMEAWHEDDPSTDAARLELLLTDLRLPAVKLMWKKLAEQSDKEGWSAARFLAALAEHGSPSAAADASLPKLACRSARRSPASTSRPSRWSARRRSWRSQPATAGSRRARREHDVAVPLPLALLDPKRHALAVDVGHLQRHDLGHPQARAIGVAERGLVLEARRSFEEARDFLLAQHDLVCSRSSDDGRGRGVRASR